MIGDAPTTVSLIGSAVLLVLSIVSIIVGRLRAATSIVYFACFAVSLGLFANALYVLIAGRGADAVTLPLGLPCISGSTHWRRSF
jgi:hypothetical protein